MSSYNLQGRREETPKSTMKVNEPTDLKATMFTKTVAGAKVTANRQAPSPQQNSITEGRVRPRQHLPPHSLGEQQGARAVYRDEYHI
jgi:hypothetical protein